jgi:hypothetical protein
MPKKKSIKLAAKRFVSRIEEIEKFFANTVALQDEYNEWCADYAVILLYREFEGLMLKTIVGAVNIDTETLFESSGVKFPKHLSEDVCTYLVIGTGYFDFKGRDGLLKTIRKFVPKTHYLYTTVKNAKYKDALEQLSALRNYAAHDSEGAKRAVLLATKAAKIGSAGAWLRVGGRFEDIASSLKKLAGRIKKEAPF